eukprot:CCRYP_015467-RA/>CCRYP_015467-RA protein AED:0.31 eAED:0.31 QI:293/1/1/1/1/1/2/321/432
MKLTLAALLVLPSHAFVPNARFVSITPPSTSTSPIVAKSAVADDVDAAAIDRREAARQKQKQALLGLLGGSDDRSRIVYDPVLADPISKEPLAVSVKGPILGGSSSSGLTLSLRTSPDSERVYAGRTDAYINLLEPVNESTSDEIDDTKSNSKRTVSTSPILSSLLTLTPPPLRPILANAANSEIEYIPMRDLFTSPSVSFAYERGWRQGFAAAGFPGPDKEFDMAREYFAPVMERTREQSNGVQRGTVVDMSCATGLFTRRFAKSNEYSRVIGCDYSDSMLKEARQRIRADPELRDAVNNPTSKSLATRLDLVRCDVAKIPLASSSIEALHAGAAMHCWPEIGPSLKEIHRVLVPGGRYFATTFLANYFQNVSGLENAANGGAQVETSMQAFQYFPSIEYLKDLLLDAGFEQDKIDVQLVGRSCVVIRCEK